MNQTLGFVSLTGETEKSNLPLNLAACLAAQGKRTLLVDLTCPAPALDILGGCAEEVVYTASDVVSERVALSRAVLPLPVKKSREQTGDVLFLLPSSPAEHLSEDACKRLLRILRTDTVYDVVLVWFSYHNVTREGLDGLFLLTDGDEVSLRAVEAQRDRLEADAFLLTGFDTDWENQRYMPPLLDTVERVALSLLGIVPRMPVGLSGMIMDGSFKRAGAYTRAVQNVAARILGKDTPLLQGVSLMGIGRRRYLTKGQ